MRITLLIILLTIPGAFSPAFTQKAQDKKGKISGQWRTFYSGTFNKGSLKDFQALATGGHVRYSYHFHKHFTMQAAGYTSFNTGIQDLTEPDPATGKLSRYEEGLFDRLNLNDKLILLAGELTASYHTPGHEISAGRMKVQSPLVNPQDGRMIPTLGQGLWYKYQGKQQGIVKLQAGVLHRIAPRSTGEFYKIGESIGTYPSGRGPDGTASSYAGNTESGYIVLANAELKVLTPLHVAVWNYYVDNIFNSVYVKPTLDLKGKNTQLALEWLHQKRVGNGGNDMPSKRYFTDRSADLVGVQMTKKTGNVRFSVAYNYITGQGRFIFPREWGRESLFSFQKRERSEGSANNHAVVIYYEHEINIGKSKLTPIASVGHHWKPSVSDAHANKYAQPDYTQVNLDIFYVSDRFPRLKPELLFTYKANSDNIPDNPHLYLNKVDMFLINLVLNYNF